MMIEDLEALVKKATEVQGYKVRIERSYNGDWFVWNMKPGTDLTYVSFEEAIARLRQLATPPKPKTLKIQIEAPYEEVERFQACNTLWDLGVRVRDACREAIAPYSV